MGEIIPINPAAAEELKMWRVERALQAYTVQQYPVLSLRPGPPSSWRLGS